MLITFLCAKYPHEEKYTLVINKRESISFKHFNVFKAFIE